MIKHVRHHVLRDVKGVSGHADERGEQAQESRDNYIAFTCLLANPDDGLLYCGVTGQGTDDR